jgi:hypothetical protein
VIYCLHYEDHKEDSEIAWTRSSEIKQGGSSESDSRPSPEAGPTAPRESLGDGRRGESVTGREDAPVNRKPLHSRETLRLQVSSQQMTTMKSMN